MEFYTDQKEIDNMLNQVRRVAGLLFYKGWSERNAGNISIKLQGRIDEAKINSTASISLEEKYPELANTCFFITGLGKRMHDISESPKENGLLIQINKSGEGFWPAKFIESNIQPSSELPTHLGIHQMIAQRGTNENVVLHTHVTELISLSHNSEINSTESLNSILLSMHPETIIFIPRGVGFISYILPGTQEIANATVAGLKEHDMVLWEKHGVFAIGKDLIDTFDSIDIASKAARIYLDCKSAGIDPEGINKKQLNELIKLSSKFK